MFFKIVYHNYSYCIENDQEKILYEQKRHTKHNINARFQKAGNTCYAPPYYTF